MSYPAGVRSILQQGVDPRRVFCTGCAHSEFVHSDLGERLCLFSECGCEGWRRLGEHEVQPGDTAEG
jgi:hypothetical protein